MRYRVNDLPPRGCGAFTPLASTNPAASSWGTVVRYSTLGLVPIPTPAPTRTWAPPISFDPRTQSSNVSPDVILPSIYVATADNMGPAADAGIGMTMRRLAPLPVPAVRIIYTGKPAFSGVKMGGRAAANQPRAFQRFPNRTRARS